MTKTKTLLGLVLAALMLGLSFLVPSTASAASTGVPSKSDKPIVVVHPATTVKAAAPAGASLAYTYTTRTQRYDLYPPGCFGYIGVIFTWSLRSDGASLETKLHTGNNMDCGS